MQEATRARTAPGIGTIKPYIAIARPDHWFKNVFMVLGTLLALFYHPERLNIELLLPLALAVAATCIVASSNYVLNEILDAPTDLSHPTKRNRPIPSGLVRIPIAYGEWLLLGAVGLSIALAVNRPFLFALISLFVMGIVYNVPPLRSKELPYLDVLSESINNPIRLVLGWFAVTATEFPPVSLLIAYWMIGAFFMATKRFAEYRHIGDAKAAADYRGSFRYYDEARLLTSMFFYVTMFALFLGVFIIRYHLELILFAPFVSGFITQYVRIGLAEDSASQNPERLYRDRWLMAYLIICLVVFVCLMFAEIPTLYEWFKVQPSQASPLWKI